MDDSTRLRYIEDLRLAHDMADEVQDHIMLRFRNQNLKVSTKPDTTLVTEADQMAEKIIRGRLRHARPLDSVLGEEYGETAGLSSFSAMNITEVATHTITPDGEETTHTTSISTSVEAPGPKRQWIIDPIDGTANFVRGVPVWATLIALKEDDEIVVSLVSAPALEQRWWAAKGCGAYTKRAVGEPKQLQVSSVDKLSNAFMSHSSITGWAQHDKLQEFLDINAACWRSRAFGDFYSYMLLAEGAVDIACEPQLELYDMAALVPIVTEAGGRFTSLDGQDGPWGGNAVATNGLLHEQFLDRFNNR